MKDRGKPKVINRCSGVEKDPNGMIRGGGSEKVADVAESVLGRPASNEAELLPGNVPIIG